MGDENFERVIQEINFPDFECKKNLSPVELLRAAADDPELKLELSLLVPGVVKHLGKGTRESEPEFHSDCERLIVHIASLGVPEDILLDFIEEAEKSDSVAVGVLLKCFLVCLETIDPGVIHPLSWCFNTVVRHLNNLDMPEDFLLEGKERLLINSDPKVVSIELLFKDVMDFVDSVVGGVLTRFFSVSENKTELKEIVIQFLLKLLGKPLAHMDLEFEEIKGSFRIMAEKIMDYISLYCVDLLQFIELVKYNEKVSNSDDVVDFEYTNLSLGVFYYLLYHEKVNADKLFEVYNPVFVFGNVVRLSLTMFEISDSLVQRKGLLMSSSLLDRISDSSLKVSDLDRWSQTKYLETLPAIMVYSEVKDNRQLAVEIFRKYLSKLNSMGRYTVLLNIQKAVPQPGFIGFLATLTKDIVAKSISEDNEDRSVFRGRKLEALIKKFCRLHKGVETDMIEISDTIISSLNLIRYLFIRDGVNSTGVWDYVDWVRDDFLAPLKKGIDLSRAHYESELKRVDSSAPGAPLNVTVAGAPLPNMDKEQMKLVLSNALNTFDLMDSLLSRVTECIENRSVPN